MWSVGGEGGQWVTQIRGILGQYIFVLSKRHVLVQPTFPIIINFFTTILYFKHISEILDLQHYEIINFKPLLITSFSTIFLQA